MAKKPRWCAGPPWPFLGNCVWGGVTNPCGVVLRVRVCVCGGAVVVCSFAFGQSDVSWDDCVQPTIALSFSISQISRMWSLTA